MKPWKFIFGITVTIIVAGAWLSWDYAQRFFKPNITLDESSIDYYVQSSWDFNDLLTDLNQLGYISDSSSFRWVADYKKYSQNIKPGRYVITDGMNNNQLVNVLRSKNEPFRLVIRSVRTKAELISLVSNTLELDSARLTGLLENEGFCNRYGFSPTSIFTLFIPNTYEFYWNTSSEEFVERMAREYKRFWNQNRLDDASKLGLSQSEVSTLASIVQSEQAAHPDERPVVAGLYLNRLKKGMRLESDPTLIHAIGDFSIKRVLNVHKQVDSPYNTYKYAGLPPGPILLPETTSIDAVLNAPEHNYIFMCAKEDFSGYHNFSASYREHINNAKRYQRALNERQIYR